MGDVHGATPEELPPRIDTGQTAPDPGHRSTVEGPDGPVGVYVWPGDDAHAATAPIVVGFHGWTDGAAVFETLHHHLGHRWTVVAIDAPAHGLTPWVPAPEYRVAEAAPGAVAVIDALPALVGRPGPLVLVGHSLGGLTAARVAVERPDLVTHLLLEDPIKVTHKASRTLSRWRTTRDASRWLAWMTNMQKLDHAGLVAWVADRNDKWLPVEYDSWARTKSEVDLAHLAVPVEWGEPLVDLLPHVKAPVTVVRGRWLRGGVSSRREGKAVVAACPAGCEIVKLEAGHNPRRDAPAAFADTLAAILDRS